MMEYDELELEKLGEEKIALFAVVSDSDPTFNFISAMMYSQMFNVLCNYKAGAGMEGMFLQTGRIFEPIRYPDGEILAFLECQPERTRAKDREAEKTSDTVKALEHREEKRPQKPPSLREQLRRAQEARPLPGASVPERER